MPPQSTDARARYTSRVANLYKEELAKRAQDDAARYVSDIELVISPGYMALLLSYGITDVILLADTLMAFTLTASSSPLSPLPQRLPPQTTTSSHHGTNQPLSRLLRLPPPRMLLPPLSGLPVLPFLAQ